MQLDVFTPIPHAFAWQTEQRPVAAVLGTELELRLFGYRDTTPLRAGQIDDEPYGGGAGMVLRVDVVAAALDAVYGGVPDHPVIALTPQGRQLDQPLVEELAREERLTLLSARFEGFDERILEHLASDRISIGPYVLSGGELPAMVLVDAIARRLHRRRRDPVRVHDPRLDREDDEDRARDRHDPVDRDTPRVRQPLRQAVDRVPHESAALLARLCSRRHCATRPWSPERSTSGTAQPRKSAGRV